MTSVEAIAISMCSIVDGSESKDRAWPARPQGQPSDFRGHRISCLLALASSIPTATTSFAATIPEDQWGTSLWTPSETTMAPSSDGIPPLVATIPQAPRDKRSPSSPQHQSSGFRCHRTSHLLAVAYSTPTTTTSFATTIPEDQWGTSLSTPSASTMAPSSDGIPPLVATIPQAPRDKRSLSRPQGQPSGFRGHRISRLLAVASSTATTSFAATILEDQWGTSLSTPSLSTMTPSSDGIPPLVATISQAPWDKRSLSRSTITGRHLAPAGNLKVDTTHHLPTAGGVDLDSSPRVPSQKQRRARSVSFGPTRVIEFEPPASDSHATTRVQQWALKLRVRQQAMQHASRFQEQRGALQRVEPGSEHVHLEQRMTCRAPPNPDAEPDFELGF
mmetsp:Transcript_135660/g.433974  ORF Transcript_135660/g.433974 Transcript_135660/m.433974 type:complete len:389 (+) Transcript_135660:74-1240(+)